MDTFLTGMGDAIAQAVMLGLTLSFLAAISVGIAQRSLEVMVEHANDRKSFGVPIREHGQIQRHIAEGFAQYRAARALVYDTARKLAQGTSSNRADADAAKLFAAGVGKQVADSAIQVLGGYGYVKEYPVERMMRDAKITQIYEGTSEVQKIVISRDLLQD